MCIGHHLLHGVHRAKNVTPVGYGDETRVLIEELVVGLLVERAVVEHGNHA